MASDSIRHHTVGYPATWHAPQLIDGDEIVAGYWEPPHQADIPYTQAENAARDIEETAAAAEVKAVQVKGDILARLKGKLSDDTITFAEIKNLLRLERGISFTPARQP